MKILLAAYACEPNNGSEPEVGWQMALQIAKAMPNDEVFVITKKNNQKIIEKEIYPENITFFYYELPKYLSFWKKKQRGVRTYYYLWMIGAALSIKKKKIPFKIIHHITFVNDWLPSFWFLLKNENNKFIWGPIGSNDRIDNKFIVGFKRKRIENIRVFLQNVFRYFDPFFYLTKDKADCIIGINENVNKKLNLNNSKIFIAEPAVAMKKSFIDSIKVNKNNTEIMTIISVGQLRYIKNFKMTILAFNEFLTRNPDANAELKIIGKGEDKNSLQELVKFLGIEKQVNFVGQIPLDDVFNEFKKADVFLFPTLENAGFVFLEAMSFSLPVVGINYGGAQQFIKSNIASQLVNSEAEYNKIVEQLAEKLNNFYLDEQQRLTVGNKNKEDLIKHFTWEAKAEKMLGIYQKILNE